MHTHILFDIINTLSIINLMTSHIFQLGLAILKYLYPIHILCMADIPDIEYICRQGSCYIQDTLLGSIYYPYLINSNYKSLLSMVQADSQTVLQNQNYSAIVPF